MQRTSISNDDRQRKWLADGCLLLAALLWGSGFVAQRLISAHLGPLTFNTARNFIALSVLLPFILLRRGRTRSANEPGHSRRETWIAGLTTGGALFAGSWLQQAGIAHTTAGNAGFITGLYVVLVPLLGAFLGRPAISTWPAALLAAVGMYLLSATESWTLGYGDLLVLASAVFWALHVHAVGHFARRFDGLKLTVLQLGICTILLIPFVVAFESVDFSALQSVAVPMLYSGIACCAVGFALQIAGQRESPPAHAAVLMSLEAVSAAFFGWFFLGENLGLRGLAGAALMFTGMLVSQWPQLSRPATPRSAANPLIRGN